MAKHLLFLSAIILLTSCSERKDTIFEKLESANTGLVFENRLTHNVSNRQNLFDYDYFYNGAGVGVEDLNNDGLLDVVFAGNQVENKLFFNQGDFVFRDASESSGIQIGNQWSNGVTFSDINADGFMDIYITQGGPNDREDRANLLYINNGDETFSEEAATYGLDDRGESTQAVFFDYDRDGDLDCFVLNENELYGYDPLSLYAYLEAHPEDREFNTSKFYENKEGVFVDVTLEAGLLSPVFGLGLVASDINKDGWIDLYVASDYYIPDALYINQKDGTFKDEIQSYTQHISFYGMGVDIADFNNDSHQEIFVLDMAAADHKRSKTLMASMNTDRFDFLINDLDYHYQYMYNTFQLNHGNGSFSNISHATKTASTDWSWSVLMEDFDLDSDKDLFITNGYRRYALDNDLQNRVNEARMRYRGNIPVSVKEELYESMPSEKLPNLLFENQGNFKLKDSAEKWGLGAPTFSNGMAVGDLDNDGDLDMIINNIDTEAFVYRNTSIENKRGNFLVVDTRSDLGEDYPKVELWSGDQYFFEEVKRVRGYRSSQENKAYFGLGDASVIDRLRVVWPDGSEIVQTELKVNQRLTINKPENVSSIITDSRELESTLIAEVTTLDIAHEENPLNEFETEILLPYAQSTQGPFLTRFDANGDGIEDVWVSGSSGSAAQLLLQQGGKLIASVQPGFEDDRVFEDADAVAFDFEGDGDLDLFVTSGGNDFGSYSSYYQDRLYLNDGDGKFSRYHSEVLAENRENGKQVVAIDIDLDGDQDIIVGNRIIPKNYPRHAPSILYENQGGRLVNVTEDRTTGFDTFGMVNDIAVVDLNGDGYKDIMMLGEWTGIGIWMNNKGILEYQSEHPLKDLTGWWHSLTPVDLDQDGLMDFVAGNVGKSIKFKTSKEKPFKIYANDFDENGSPDIVLSKVYNDTYVPVRGKECSTQQMPFISNKFKTYEAFASASLDDIYGEKLTEAYEREVITFESVLLRNKCQLNFEVETLPFEAQLFPILSAEVITNEDDKRQLLLFGNIYNTEVETPRLDGVGALPIALFENGQLDQNISSDQFIKIQGNIKSSVFLPSMNAVIVGLNDDYLHQLKLNY